MPNSARYLDRSTSFQLTGRELQVLEMFAEGLSTRDIASRLCRAEMTVANHIRSILFKLQAANRAHAVTLAHRSGLI